MSLSQYSLKLISEECRSLLVRGRLDQIRQLGRNQIGFQFYTDSGRRDLVLDICPAYNWLYLATIRPKSQDPDARVMFLRKYLNKQPLVAWEQFPEDRLIRLHWGSGHILVLELSGRHANLFLLDAEQSIMLSWIQSHSQRLLRSGKVYQPPVSMAFREQRDPYLLAVYPADGTRSLHLQQWHLFDQAFASLRLRIQRLKKELTHCHKKTQKEILRLNQDFERLDESETWKKQGELLQSAYGKVVKGQSEVELIDYYDPEQKTVLIALDPKLDLNLNIRRCFQLSKKRERAAEWALKTLPDFESRLSEINQALEFIAGLDIAWPATIEGTKPPFDCLDLPKPEWEPQLVDLEKLWLVEPVVQKKATQAKPAMSKRPYRSFESLAGKEIRVGKKARDNDALSFRLANGRDLWLHARNLAGSHVIVCLNKGEEVDEQTLLDAATLAVYFSKAKDEPRTEVMYTAVKHLKKPKAAAAGRVLAANTRSLILASEPERLQRLLKQGKIGTQSEGLL